jgi:hypothetical protein
LENVRHDEKPIVPECADRGDLWRPSRDAGTIGDLDTQRPDEQTHQPRTDRGKKFRAGA